jgi:hypothetical protein
MFSPSSSATPAATGWSFGPAMTWSMGQMGGARYHSSPRKAPPGVGYIMPAWDEHALAVTMTGAEAHGFRRALCCDVGHCRHLVFFGPQQRNLHEDASQFRSAFALVARTHGAMGGAHPEKPSPPSPPRAGPGRCAPRPRPSLATRGPWCGKRRSPAPSKSACHGSYV